MLSPAVGSLLFVNLKLTLAPPMFSAFSGKHVPAVKDESALS